jgi:microcystin-dependent protein
MSTVTPYGSAELTTTLSTLGADYLGQNENELLTQILVAVANRNGGTGGGAITGEGKLWFTGTAPTGWLLCNGDAVSRTTYADLFAVIGTTFGTGDGSTTFNVPDFRGRVPAGDGGTGSFTPIGLQLGVESTQLVPNEVPALDITIHEVASGSGTLVVSNVWYQAQANQPVTNIQPTLVVNFIIKT